MVFEYVENGDLVGYFKKNPLFEEDYLRDFFVKILKGIKYLHSKNILHRDIKLDNLLLDKEMNPKLCDFGISSEQKPNKKIFDSGGTPAYLAPEVIKCEGEVGQKSDVWSLGVLLYLLAYGFVPFKAKNMQVLYNKIIAGNVTFPDSENEFISSNLRNLLKNILVVDLNKRYSLADVFRHPWI